jgi:CRP/FNR family cyclic AMP-dependent transcriptional regulator
VAIADALASVPLFSQVSRRALTHLGKVTHEHTYQRGSEVTTTGRSGVGFFIILEGTARVEVPGRRAKLLRAGDYFGEMALIDGGPRTAVVRAETDLRCQVLTDTQFKAFALEHPDVTWALLRAMVQRLRESES